MTKFPGSDHFPLSFPSALSSLSLFCNGKIQRSDNIQVLHLWEYNDKGARVCLTCGCLSGLVPSGMYLTFLALKQEGKGKEGKGGDRVGAEMERDHMY